MVREEVGGERERDTVVVYHVLITGEETSNSVRDNPTHTGQQVTIVTYYSWRYKQW